ncbi:MAG: hypothetical protein A2W26_06595 [Acidobacteria bacterium RBG_16_64_8]|nr:MAG: hypothetical protein A2W26_06595 [Acidobacteria bacterium RBG_16_64_8]
MVSLLRQPGLQGGVRLGLLAGDVRRPLLGSAAGILGKGRLQGGVQLRQHYLYVPLDAAVGAKILPDLPWVVVDVDDLGAGGKGCLSMQKALGEQRAADPDKDIHVMEDIPRLGACGVKIPQVLAMGDREVDIRHPRLVDAGTSQLGETDHLIQGVAPGHAALDEDKGSLGPKECLHGLRQSRSVRPYPGKDDGAGFMGEVELLL